MTLSSCLSAEMTKLSTITFQCYNKVSRSSLGYLDFFKASSRSSLETTGYEENLFSNAVLKMYFIETTNQKL